MKEKLKKINIMKKKLGRQHVKQKKITSNGFFLGGGGGLGKDITLNMLKLMMKIITTL